MKNDLIQYDTPKMVHRSAKEIGMKEVIRKRIGKNIIGVCGVSAAVLLLSGCAPKALDYSSVTMDALCDANDVQTLLSKHKSVLVSYNASDPDEANSLYVDADYLYQRFDDSSIIVSKEDIWNCDYSDDEHQLFYYWHAMDENEEREMRYVPSDYEIIERTFTSKEAIEDIQKNSDGTLTITTMLSAEDTEEMMKMYNLDYPEGHNTVEQRTVYVVDKETLEIVFMSSTIVLDGKDDAASSVDITLGADKPNELSEILKRITEAGNVGKTRNIKVVYDYGTEEEQSFEMKARESFRVVVITRDGYETLYNDPDKKEVYAGGDGMSDMTIYAFAGE